MEVKTKCMKTDFNAKKHIKRLTFLFIDLLIIAVLTEVQTNVIETQFLMYNLIDVDRI